MAVANCTSFDVFIGDHFAKNLNQAVIGVEIVWDPI